VSPPVQRVVRYGALWSYSLYLCNLPVQRIIIWRNIGGTTVLARRRERGILAVAVAWAAAKLRARRAADHAGASAAARLASCRRRPGHGTTRAESELAGRRVVE
jgi:hypothetical protein